MKFIRNIHLRSKNQRMFFYSGLVLLLFMFFFFAVKIEPKEPEIYIGFAFIWLSVIVSTCLLYLVPRKSDKANRLFYSCNIIYLIAILIATGLLVGASSFITLIWVDFALTFGIILYSLIFYYIDN